MKKRSVSSLTWVDRSCVASGGLWDAGIFLSFRDQTEDMFLVFGGYTPLRFSAVA